MRKSLIAKRRIGQCRDASFTIGYRPRLRTSRVFTSCELTDTEEGIGTFTLIRGTPGRLVKCLLPLHTVVSCLGGDSRIAR